jgi:hypothetical protein
MKDIFEERRELCSIAALWPPHSWGWLPPMPFPTKVMGRFATPATLSELS